MKITKTSKIGYTLNEGDISRIVLKSMGLHEDWVDNITFTVECGGRSDGALTMDITVSLKDDPVEEELVIPLNEEYCNHGGTLTVGEKVWLKGDLFVVKVATPSELRLVRDAE